MRTRETNLVVRIDEEERAKLRALEADQDENASRLVRKWIATHYRATFGEKAPARKTGRA